MAFIWNDETAKFVGLEEDWDKNEYVIVRKLFVELNESGHDKDEVRRFPIHLLNLTYN